MTNHIALFEPLFPANTGNIARTCAGTDTILDLIKPLGFSVVDVRYHENLPAFLDTISDLSQLYLVSKFADQDYTEPDYQVNEHDHYFLFGKETTGLPEPFMRQHAEKCIRIPQDDTHIRALNLSNSAAIVIYEVLRQQQFLNLERVHQYPHDKLK